MLSEDLFTAGRLCVVGNINRDIKTAPLRADERLLRDGETPVASITETIGGGGANSAFTAAALGGKVAFLGKVGDDALGRTLEELLVRHRIAAHLVRDPACVTGSSLALSYDHGHRHFISCQPNNESLRFEELALTSLAGFSHLLRADIWFSKSMLFGGNARLFQAARERGLAVSIDLNWDPQWGIACPEDIRLRKQAVRDALRWVNVAHGNVRELTTFADADNLDSALHRLAQWGVETVVVHLGADGAGYYHHGQFEVEPAVPVARQINTTGTGDVLSVCMMLLHTHPDVSGKLRLANSIVSQFIEGQRQFIPAIT